MSDRFKAFWLGIFIIAGIVIIAWLILFLKPSVGDGRLTLRVRFSNIDKVVPGTRVTFAGKPVGEVEKIVEVTDPRTSPSDEFGNLYIYELTLKTDSHVHVYSYDEIIFATSGLLGEKSIAIIPKAAPPGAPPPQEVTQEILFARSTDKLEATLYQLTQVAETFEETMEGVNNFLSANTNDFNATLKSLTGAADEVKTFMADARQNSVMGRAATAADSLATTMKRTDLLISELTGQITSGSGTLGRLIKSDAFYLQMSTMVNKANTMLNDINNYGLLFQYDKGWQRKRSARINQMRQLCTPCDFYHYFDREMCDMSLSLDRMGQLLQTMECREIFIEKACFSENFRELLDRVDCLQHSLKLYTEMLMEEYCDNCECR